MLGSLLTSEGSLRPGWTLQAPGHSTEEADPGVRVVVLESVVGVDGQDLRRAEVARRRGGAARGGQEVARRRDEAASVGQLGPQLRVAVTALIVEKGRKFSLMTKLYFSVYYLCFTVAIVKYILKMNILKMIILRNYNFNHKITIIIEHTRYFIIFICNFPFYGDQYEAMLDQSAYFPRLLRLFLTKPNSQFNNKVK